MFLLSRSVFVAPRNRRRVLVEEEPAEGVVLSPPKLLLN